MALVRIRHKELEALTFGPGGDDEFGIIQFGPKGGFAPGEVVIDEDHPLYDELWAREGAQLEVVTDGPPKVYISPIDSSEFPSRAALLSHVRNAAKAGDELALAWIKRADVADEIAALVDPPAITRPAFSGPQDDVDGPDEPAAKPPAPAKRRATRRGKGRSATRQSRVVAHPAPLPPAGPLPSTGG